MVAGVPVDLDRHSRVIVAVNEGPGRTALQELQVHADAAIAVQLGFDLDGRAVVDVKEPQAAHRIRYRRRHMEREPTADPR